MMNIGKRIKELRNIKDISSKQLAITMGFTSSFMSAIENDKKKCSLETLNGICSAIGVTLAEFFSTEPQDLTSLPSDIFQFVSDKKNHSLIKQIQAMKDRGQSNEMIFEWLISLEKTINEIKNKHEQVFWKAGDTKHSEQEKQEVLNGLSRKFQDPNFISTWDKKE